MDDLTLGGPSDANHPRLAMFDSLLRKGIGTICNLDLTDIQWLQTSLRRDGCATRFVAGILCFSRFCRSSRHTPATAVISQLDRWATDASVSMVRDVWSTAYATDCPTGPAATKQSTWERATPSERQAVTSSLSDATDKARLLLVTPPQSSDCTHFRYPAAVCDLTTVPSTPLLAFDWEPTYVSLISAFAERPFTQEDCMVSRAEWATVDPHGITV